MEARDILRARAGQQALDRALEHVGADCWLRCDYGCLLPIVFKLQIESEVLLFEMFHDGLQFVFAFALHPDLFSLNLSLSLEFGLFNRFRDGFGLIFGKSALNGKVWRTVPPKASSTFPYVRPFNDHITFDAFGLKGCPRPR